ncbi:M15 family metallopeptidase [Brevibacillus laterosporus]|uniref:M15 family metallopeptidase n=1 Tax=Brevibacillus laterosporus TaxID=1465 RepID=UPI0002D562D2|nr:M15 family metallopeptidase [Brevibacillus laterosporus]
MTVALEALIDRSITNMKDGINPTVKKSALELIRRAYEENIFVLITSGFRSMEEQAALYGQGRESYVYNGKDYGDPTKPIVTQVKPGKSNHNFGLAIDFVLLSEDGNRAIWDVNDNWIRVANMGKELGFKWGGDWTSFKDYPHLEMKDLNPNSSRPMLHLGDTGVFVKQLQKALTKAGFFTGSCDRIFEALINFQEANNLSADGIAGPMTWKALDRY